MLVPKREPHPFWYNFSFCKRSSLLKPLKSGKEPFYGSFSLCADKIRINANNKFSFNFGGMSALYDNYIRG